MKARIVVVLTTAVIVACTTPTQSTDFPFDSYDYTTSQITLGLSFPPVNGAAQYQVTFDAMSNLSMDRIRLDLHWDYIEPIRGSRDWSSLDARLDTLTAKDYEVFLTIDLKSFPNWLSGLSDAEQQADLRTFVQELLGGYADQIGFLQFGNEWNWEVQDHFDNDLDQFIALADIVYDETILMSEPRPEVVLASLSTAGLSALAISQGRIDNVYFDGSPLYTQAEIDGFDKPGYLDQVDRVLGGIGFESIDLHFYADYWNWDVYLDALEQALDDAELGGSYPVIASEFGGAHPVKESLDQETQADRIVSYVHTLDSLGIRDAYFFKLVENPAHDTEFWNSFLIDSGLNETLGYEVMRRFGAAAVRRSSSHRETTEDGLVIRPVRSSRVTFAEAPVDHTAGGAMAGCSARSVENRSPDRRGVPGARVERRRIAVRGGVMTIDTHTRDRRTVAEIIADGVL